MSVNAERLFNEAIIVVTYTPPFKGEDVITANQKVSEIAAEINGEIYRIADMRNVQIPWPELLTALQEATRRNTGTLRDTRIHSIFVGTDESIRLAVDSLRQAQYGSIQAGLFATLDEAVSFARRQLSQN
ncbi:MAG: hypothetical protein SF029_18925 [bacterium]|nr:hypothetical protein [bacterium]